MNREPRKAYTIRLNSGELAAIKTEAHKRGMNVAEYIRWASLDCALPSIRLPRQHRP